MNILKALHEEEKKLESRLSAIQAAIGALNHSGNGRRGSWKMSASAKARIAKAQRARWRKIRAAKKM